MVLKFYIQAMVDWSKLPNELWRLIAGKLRLIEDYLRFGGVSRSWHLITLEKESYSCSELPWVMLTENEASGIRGFHSLFGNKIYKLLLPEICGRRCWGSSHGWLVSVGTDLEMHILNPLSHVQISLPPLHKCPNLGKLICSPVDFRDNFVYKVVISSSPLDSNCIIMAIYSDCGKIAFTRPIDKGWSQWTPLECANFSIHDIIYYNGNIYAVESYCDVLVFNFSGSLLKTIPFEGWEEGNVLDYDDNYLVECGGEIYMVVRCFYDTRNADTPFLKTWRFLVYKLDKCTDKWEKVDGLGNWSVFLGSNNSFSILASNDSRCRKNCIYFTDDHYGWFNTPGSYDMGIYDLDNGKLEPYLLGNASQYVYSVPLWIRPSLW